MLTFDQFIEKYKGKGIDFDGHYGFQCVDLIRQYIKEVLNQPQPKGVTGAKDFFTNFETDPNLNQYFNKIVNTPEGVPNRGDIIIWGATYGAYGHIAIVNWANASQFQALSQNDPISSLTILKNYSYNHILGWFSPKGDGMADMYNGYDLANRESMKVAVDVLVRVQKGEFVESSKVDELVKIKTAELSSKISNYEKRITELDGQLKACLEKPVSGLPLEKDYEEMLQEVGKMLPSGAKRVANKKGEVSVEISYKVKE